MLHPQDPQLLNIDGGVELNSSRCTHDLSFMALANIVSELNSAKLCKKMLSP